MREYKGGVAIVIFCRAIFFISPACVDCDRSAGDWTVVVAQLVEQSLLIPEVCSLNPVIGKNLY